MYFKKIGPDDYQLTVTGEELAVLIGFPSEVEMNKAAQDDYGSTNRDAIHSVMCEVLNGIEDIRILGTDAEL